MRNLRLFNDSTMLLPRRVVSRGFHLDLQDCARPSRDSAHPVAFSTASQARIAEGTAASRLLRLLKATLVHLVWSSPSPQRDYSPKCDFGRGGGGMLYGSVQSCV